MTFWASWAFADVEIEGVDGETAEVFRGFLSIDELPCDSPRWWVRRRFNQAPVEIRSALETLGYYNATMESELAWEETCWAATFTVETGKPVEVERATLEVDGSLADEPRMVALLDEPPLKVGDDFSHRAYQALKDELLDVARDLGYFDADFAHHRVEVDPEANSAAIELTLSGGIRYRVGEVLVDQRSLEPELFERYLAIETGEYYDADDLTATYRNLLESDFFGRVVITPLEEQRENGEVPIRVAATPGSRRIVQLGGGYATDTGPRIRGDLRYRRINDRGHRASIGGLLSKLSTEVRAQYRLPYDDPKDDWLFTEASYIDETTDTSERTTYALGVGRTQRRGRHWIETNYVDYQLEDFQIGDQQDGRSNLLILGTSWSRTTTIDAPRPLHGFSLDADVRGASKHVLSDNTFLQLILRGRYILPLGQRVRVLARAHGGWTWQDEFDELPPSVRFFAGGDNSVRGYGYEQLGPEENGEVVGGRKLLTGSLELDTLIRENWSIAAFVDTGSAFNDKPDFSTGVGLGIRWYSPLGPLRLDLAHPLDDPDRDVRIHISLGTDL